jgi:hypothetical protein
MHFQGKFSRFVVHQNIPHSRFVVCLLCTALFLNSNINRRPGQGPDKLWIFPSVNRRLSSDTSGARPGPGRGSCVGLDMKESGAFSILRCDSRNVGHPRRKSEARQSIYLSEDGVGGYIPGLRHLSSCGRMTRNGWSMMVQ